VIRFTTRPFTPMDEPLYLLDRIWLSRRTYLDFVAKWKILSYRESNPSRRARRLTWLLYDWPISTLSVGQSHFLLSTKHGNMVIFIIFCTVFEERKKIETQNAAWYFSPGSFCAVVRVLVFHYCTRSVSLELCTTPLYSHESLIPGMCRCGRDNLMTGQVTLHLDVSQDTTLCNDKDFI
jgi:hypothetical protein